MHHGLKSLPPPSSKPDHSFLTHPRNQLKVIDMLNSCGHALSQGMGVTSTHDATGRQLPLVIAPARELGDVWLHAMGPCLPGLTMAAQESWKNMGMLAGVTDCRRSQKWGCRGRLALGFKPRCSSHTRERTMRFWRRRERFTQLWQSE